MTILFASAALGCTTTTVQPLPTAAPDAGTTTPTPDNGPVAQDTGVTTPDPGKPGDDPGTATEDSSVTPPQDTGESLGGVCGVADHPGEPIGAPCTDHAQCATGYCYDEALWNEDGQQSNRFCTAACGACTVVGNCNEWPKWPGTGENKCYPFTGAFINLHGLTAKSLCLATCTTSANCADLAPFTKCAPLAFGKESNSGVYKVCQPESIPLPEQ